MGQLYLIFYCFFEDVCEPSAVVDDFTKANASKIEEGEITGYPCGQPDVLNEAVSFTETPTHKTRGEENLDSTLKRLSGNQGEQSSTTCIYQGWAS